MSSVWTLCARSWTIWPDHKDQTPTSGEITRDAEAGAAVDETVEADGAADLPVLTDDRIKASFRGDERIVLIAAQSSVDEAAALMWSQILQTMVYTTGCCRQMRFQALI
jgi:hypothetical protein